MSLDFTLEWRTSVPTIIEEKIRKKGQTVLFMAETWRRLINPFTPMDTGYLANDGVNIVSEGQLGIIHYQASYARKCYDGTNIQFQRHKHPFASAKWDEAGKRAGKKEVLIKDVEEYIRRG